MFVYMYSSVSIVSLQYIVFQNGQHADYVKTACIMSDVDTGHYLDAFECPMRFALHGITVREVLSVVL